MPGRGSDPRFSDAELTHVATNKPWQGPSIVDAIGGLSWTVIFGVAAILVFGVLSGIGKWLVEVGKETLDVVAGFATRSTAPSPALQRRLERMAALEAKANDAEDAAAARIFALERAVML